VTDAAIREAAREAGIAIDWIDAADQPQTVSIDSLKRILEALDHRGPVRPMLLTATIGKPTSLPDLASDGAAELQLEDGTRRALKLRAGELPAIDTAGYHLLRYADREIAVAVAPPRCLTVSDIASGKKLWGLAVQLYSLRRANDGGIGDTSALASLVGPAVRNGADAIALSPAHALFPWDLNRYSPYAPSSRLFLNPLLADPTMTLGRGHIEAAASDADLIDWTRSAQGKYALFKKLFNDFTQHDLAQGSETAQRFQAFVREGGARLDEHVRFEAAHGGDPTSYYAFLQWIAADSFAAAQKTARNAGMRIGLIADLAVGVDGGGSEVAARPKDYLSGLGIGAPPDLFNPQGQDWGLTSFAPGALLARGFEPFLATLRATLRHAGGIRIDHAMGLMRLWVVPHGRGSREGAYLAYPMEDLMRLLALESHRHRAIVVGEDLGTVPPAFRARCRDAGIAGMDVLWFQRDKDGRFLSPDQWRDDAVAMTTTHDLPTVAGWWSGSDIEVRRSLDLATEAEIEPRAGDRAALWRTFEAAGAAGGPPPPTTEPGKAVDAAFDFIGRTPAPLALIPVEDVLGLSDQPNLPGTIDQHPNWRRRLPVTADKLLDQPAARRHISLLRRGRA